MKTTTTLENNNIKNEDKRLILLAEKNEIIAKMEVELDSLKQQMAAMTKSKFGSTSKKVIDGQLNFFNEIE